MIDSCSNRIHFLPIFQHFFKLVVAFSWILSISISLAVVFGLVSYLDESQMPEIPSAVSLTYSPLHRTAWAVAVGWIIFACIRGYGGIYIQNRLHQCNQRILNDFCLQGLLTDFYLGRVSCH